VRGADPGFVLGFRRNGFTISPLVFKRRYRKFQLQFLLRISRCTRLGGLLAITLQSLVRAPDLAPIFTKFKGIDTRDLN
jgi:hypothetical protein